MKDHDQATAIYSRNHHITLVSIPETTTTTITTTRPCKSSPSNSRPRNIIRHTKFQRKSTLIVPSQNLYIQSRTHLPPHFREQFHPNQTKPYHVHTRKSGSPRTTTANMPTRHLDLQNAAQMLHPANGHDRALHSYLVPTMHICVNDRAVGRTGIFLLTCPSLDLL